MVYTIIVLFVFHCVYRDSEGCTLAVFRVNVYGSLVQIDHFLYVCQSQSEALYVVSVACMHPVEAFEDFFQVVFLYSYTRVLYRYADLSGRRVPCAQVTCSKYSVKTIELFTK